MLRRECNLPDLFFVTAAAIFVISCGLIGCGFAPRAAVLQSLSLTTNAVSIPLGETTQYAATGIFSDRAVRDMTNSIVWSSSNPAIATVNSNGLVSTFAVGSVVITAASGQVTAGAILNISPAQITSISISPGASKVALGLNAQFTATATYTNKTVSDVTTTVTWSSSSTQVALIASTGNVSTVAVGTTTISASSGAIVSTAVLTVGPAELRSVRVTPENPQIRLGTSQEFRAIGTYTDMTTEDLTPMADWSSSDPEVLMAFASGLTMARFPAGATVKATYRAVVGTAAATVFTPVSKFLFAIGPSGLETFRINTPDGSLTPVGVRLPGTFANVGVSADGDFVYVADEQSRWDFKINQETGSLTAVETPQIGCGSAIYPISGRDIHPLSWRQYFVDRDWLWSHPMCEVQHQDKILFTALGGAPDVPHQVYSDITGLSLDPFGTRLVITTRWWFTASGLFSGGRIYLWKLDGEGNAEHVSTTDVAAAEGVVFDAFGRRYVYGIDEPFARVRFFFTEKPTSYPDPSGSFIYIANDQGLFVYQMDPITGVRILRTENGVPTSNLLKVLDWAPTALAISAK